MTDAAEDWLRENDPQYAVTSQAWKHVKTGEYKTPPQEVPVGLFHQNVVYVEPVEDRACGSCGAVFSPRESKHVYCTSTCKEREKKRRQRGRADTPECPPSS